MGNTHSAVELYLSCHIYLPFFYFFRHRQLLQVIKQNVIFAKNNVREYKKQRSNDHLLRDSKPYQLGPV